MCICRLREERGDDKIEREQRSRERDITSHHGSSNGHSPVLNLSKSNVDQGSAGDHSDRSGAHTPLSTHGVERDDENLSDGNATDPEERNDKDEGR